MTDEAVRVHVDVRVDPAAAFRIFTEEIDQWWVRGPANFYDGARARGMRFEPGLGGRLVQVNDGAEDRELGRVTSWEPGQRLAYETDDGATVDVRFEPAAAGTRVIVEQRGPGMSAWPNILGWFVHRAEDGYRAAEMPRVTPVLLYADVPAAAEWLSQAFGFWGRGGFGADYAEVELHGGVVLLRRAEGEAVGLRAMTYVYVDDLDAHLARAQDAGARMVEPVHRRGDTAYVAEDPEGHRWTFAQARASMRAPR
ncbi:MAG: VOC family protein [Solirubrobacteraceae bacterium]